MAMMTVDKMNSFDWGLTAPRCVDLGVQKKNVGEMWYRFFFSFFFAPMSHAWHVLRSGRLFFVREGGRARDDVRLYFCLLIIARL